MASGHPISADEPTAQSAALGERILSETNLLGEIEHLISELTGQIKAVEKFMKYKDTSMVKAVMLSLEEAHSRLHKTMNIYAKEDFSCSVLKERFEEINDRKRKLTSEVSEYLDKNYPSLQLDDLKAEPRVPSVAGSRASRTSSRSRHSTKYADAKIKKEIAKLRLERLEVQRQIQEEKCRIEMERQRSEVERQRKAEEETLRLDAETKKL